MGKEGNSQQTGKEQGEQRAAQLKKIPFVFCRKSSAPSLLPHRRRKRIYLVYILLHPILNQSFCLCVTQVCHLSRGWRAVILLNHTQSPRSGGICPAFRWKTGHLPCNPHPLRTLIDFYVKTLFGFDKWLKPHYSCPVSTRKPSKLHLQNIAQKRKNLLQSFPPPPFIKHLPPLGVFFGEIFGFVLFLCKHLLLLLYIQMFPYRMGKQRLLTYSRA